MGLFAAPYSCIHNSKTTWVNKLGRVHSVEQGNTETLLFLFCLCIQNIHSCKGTHIMLVQQTPLNSNSEILSQFYWTLWSDFVGIEIQRRTQHKNKEKEKKQNYQKTERMKWRKISISILIEFEFEILREEWMETRQDTNEYEKNSGWM